MSTDPEDEHPDSFGVPELTALGKRLELLRIERRMSKRVLAQRAGTSRQQLWRVMTGKSELTSSLCARLSEVLETDSRVLREAPNEPGSSTVSPAGDSSRTRDSASASGDGKLCETLEEYVTATHGLERTLLTLPLTRDGRHLRRALLDAVEDIAMSRCLKLPQSVFDLRRSAVNDDDP
ncbi:MAG TPA: helix-turn-helix transcriptional regulator [Gemmatimonadaceae bacterium]|nr:helix-turn-helix transcriptional regulator [Gemmatimonadaceae bacterium]